MFAHPPLRRRRVASPAAVVAVLATLVAAALVAAAPAPAAERNRALRPFGDCRELVRYARRHAARHTPGPPPAAMPTPAPAAGGPVAAPDSEGGAPERSGTNTQEAGVGEPDTVKTDGRTVFALAGGRLRIVDVTGREPVLLRSVDIDAGHDASMFLRHGRLLVLSSRHDAGVAQAPDIAPMPGAPRTLLTLVDVREPARPEVLQTLTADGRLVAARRTGDLARIVLSALPPAVTGPAAAQERPRNWLPRGTFSKPRRSTARTRRLVGCRSVRRPRAFAGLATTTVLTLDFAAGLSPLDADAVLGGAETVYASTGSLYVATRRHAAGLETRTDGPVPERVTTEVHRFAAADAAETTYRGSGRVRGFLLSQFALSEHDGVLRVASTDEPSWFDAPRDGETSESFVTTLRLADAGLAPLGQIGGLGRGERIYAVRFLGDTGYVVTFRETDPLYTVDLADPARPRVRGELELLGYSAYLHPVGDGRLVGVGQDATAQGRRLGVQVSLFDVSDPAAPRLLQRQSLGGDSSTDVEWDHHAFLWWPRTDLAVIPVSTWQAEPTSPGTVASTGTFVGAIGFRVRDGGIAEAGRVSHTDAAYGAPITRSLVIGDRLYTLSAAGLAASTLDAFAPAGFAAFG